MIKKITFFQYTGLFTVESSGELNYTTAITTSSQSQQETLTVNDSQHANTNTDVLVNLTVYSKCLFFDIFILIVIPKKK